MRFSIQERHPLLSAAIVGLDLREKLSPEDVTDIEKAIARYPALVFPNQDITDEQQQEFSRNFGPLQVAVAYETKPGEHRLASVMTDISNLGKDQKTFAAGDRRRMNNLGSRRWHTDASYQHPPGKYSMLSARRIPHNGGDTQFADMRAAYDALSDAMRAMVENLVVVHDVIYSRGVAGFTEFSDEERAALPPKPQRLVRRHPISGRKSLYLSGHASHILGWPIPEGRDLLYELTDFATRPQFVHSHKWAVGDLVMWDNRSSMHRATRFLPETDVRDMRRCTVVDYAPTLEQPV